LDGEGDLETMPDADAMPGFPIDLSTVSKVRSIFLRDLVRISCFLVLGLSVWFVCLNHRKGRNALGLTFATIRLFKNAFVIPSNATLAWRTLLGAYTFHFEAPTNLAGSATRELGSCGNQKVSANLEPLVGLALDSPPSTEAAVPSSSLRRLLLSLSLSKVPVDSGRLLEPGKGIGSAGGVLIASEAWEEGDERPGPNGSWET
jgi:hypothetical protein